MEIGYFLCAIFLAICLVDVHNHNKKYEHTISMYPFGILMIMLIGLFIKSCL